MKRHKVSNSYCWGGALKNLSVVIPLYNSAPFIEQTLRNIEVSAGETASDLEVIVVDDGSTDESGSVVEKYKESSALKIQLIRVENQGAFFARWEGSQLSKRKWLVFLDSRQLVQDDYFPVLQKLMLENPDIKVWCNHVDTDTNSALVGQFWTVLTNVFWGAYWRNMKRTFITVDNFDSVPKGTGGLIIIRSIFDEHCIKIWPKESQKFISDDTKLLRSISEELPIVLEPSLKSIYRPRVTVAGFLGHSFNRGTLFIDSYMNTSVFRFAILIAGIFSPLILLASLLFFPSEYRVPIVSGAALFFVTGLLTLISLGLKNQAPVKSAISFTIYALPFALVFWAGLARGLVVHRGTLKVRKSKS